MSPISTYKLLFSRQLFSALLLGQALLFVSCEDKFMKQGTADKRGAIATLKTTLDDSGNHVASFDPTKAETQLMKVTSGAIAGAAVAIPPSSLSIPLSIAVGEGVSLATSSFSQNLGITDNKINAGGPSVSFTASQDVVATNPMTLSIPFGATSLSLNDTDSENLVVMYRWTTIVNGEAKFEAGILPGDSVTRAKNKVSFQTKNFGTFQVGVAEKRITTQIAAKTEEPPALKSCERYAAELYPNCSSHGQTGCMTTGTFRAVDRTFLRAEFILSSASIQNLQGNVLLPLESQVRAGTPYGASGNQFTGTFSLNAENAALKACERFTAAVYQPCAKDGQVGCVTNDAFKAADMTLIRPETILAGRMIAGVAGSVILPTRDNVIAGTPFGPIGASMTGTSFAAIPTLSYAGSTGNRIQLGQTFSVSPTSLVINGSNIIACGTKVGTTSLPAGVIVNQNTCVISGAPPAILSPANFKIVATNAVGTSTESDITLAVLDTVATPTFSVSAGAYGPAQTVSISTSTSGATLYYTTDGTTPTTASNVYSTAINVASSMTIRAFATKSTFYDSSVATAAYTINGAVATPTFSVAEGSYNSTQSVTISTTTASASIYYTTNGVTPTTASTLYTGPVSVSSPLTLRAFAVKSGFLDSSQASASYVIDTTPPTITLASVTTTSPGTTQTPSVTFTSNEAGTCQLFSVAGCGSGSISSSASLLASSNSATTSALTANATTSIYVRATDALGNFSCTLIGSYTHDNTAPVAPVIADTTRSFNSAFNTNIQQGVPADANFKEFRYTTNSDDPTCASGTASSTQPTSVAITAVATTLKVISCDLVGLGSLVATSVFTYDTTPPNAPTVTGTTPTSNTMPTWNWSSGGGGNGTYRYKLNNNDLTTGAATTTSTSFTSGTALSEATHTLYVQERDAAGNWSTSGSLAIQVVTPPAAPALSSPIRYVTSLGLSWGSVTGATAYNLYWSTIAGVTTASTRISNVTSVYTHTPLTGGTTYYYRLAAVKSGIEGALSNEVNATPDVVPNPPTVLNVNPANAYIMLSWTAPLSNGGTAITNYSIQYSTDGGASWMAPVLTGSTSTNFTFTGLASGTTYLFRVAAVNAAGTGSYSSNTTVAALTFNCPTNYVKVGANTLLGTSEFCVAKYEMKNVSNVATSQAASDPWGNITRDEASTKCLALGPNYDLISNAQWQALARDIETAQNPTGIYLNWSNNSTSGNNYINRGHSDNTPAYSLSADFDTVPCAGTLQANCATNSHSDFTQKRTHTLKSGDVIWDFAGNVWEWVKYNNTSSQAPDGFISLQSGWDTADTLTWGPEGVYTSKNSGEYGGLGFGWLNYSEGAVIRGGHFGSTINSGVFAASLQKQSTFSNSDTGFRCVFLPSIP